ncbi:MAG: Kef-type K+ transport system membrane component KefB/mannitol [Rhodothermales bacterium]|jgi:Kef-type K+ transport system membrane component KefB/mannitol/fructose-specific phosphotransferase system IIA component (Ntr-type)
MELDYLNLFAVLLAAWLAGWLASHLGFPAVLGELIAGVVLGPPMLGLLHGTEALYVLAELGVLLMMLHVGMEIDLRSLKRASWAGLLAAIGGFFIPFGLGYFAVIGFGGTHVAGLFVGIAAGSTCLAVNSRILLDLRILDTRISHVMMVGALVADILSLLVFSAVIGIVQVGGLAMDDLLLLTLKAGAFFAVTALLGMKLFPYLGRLLAGSGLTGRTFNFTLLLIIAVLFGELAEIAGLHAIIGAFIAGLFIRENVLGLTLSRALRGAVRDTSIGLLTPIFFVTAGFGVSFGVFDEYLGLFLVVFAVAMVGKILGTALFYLPSGHGWREGLVIGAGLNGRGGVDIVLIGIALEMGIIEQDTFSIMIFMALLTTAAVPVLLKSGVRWLQRRGALERSGLERDGVVIVGAGPLARWLARALGRTQPVTLVDTNERHCMVAKSEGLTVVYGSALREQILGEAKAAQATTLIAMTPNAEVNTLVAQAARSVFRIPDVYLVQSGSELSEQALLRGHIGADALFASTVDLGEWDHRISHGKTTHSSVRVERTEDAASYVSRLQEGRPCLVLAVLRGNEAWPLHERTELVEGDEAILITAKPVAIQRDRFDKIVAECPILDLKQLNSAEDFFDLVAGLLADKVDMEQESLARMFLRGEAWSSTVVAPGIAIPHILLMGRHPFQFVVARSIKGIHFPGQDDKVHIIFVLVSTKDDRNFHLRALSAIAQIAQDEAFQESWMTAESPEALRKLILDADRRRVPQERPPSTGSIKRH